jgi:hypothetical protein
MSLKGHGEEAQNSIAEFLPDVSISRHDVQTYAVSRTRKELDGRRLFESPLTEKSASTLFTALTGCGQLPLGTRVKRAPRRYPVDSAPSRRLV